MNKRKVPAHAKGTVAEIIIKEAFSLLDELGPDAVTIRAVARRAGVSHAAPANHYSDRQRLLTELAKRIFRGFEVQTNEQISGIESNEEIAKAIMRSLADLGLNFPARFELLWRKDLIDWEDRDLLDMMDRVYCKLVCHLGPIAELRGLEADTLAILLWSTVQGYVTLRNGHVFDERLDTILGISRIEAILHTVLQ